MKITPLLSLLVAAGLVAGCKSTGGSSNHPPSHSGPAAGNFDTAKLIEAFKNADTDTVATCQAIAADVNKHNYSSATANLQKLKKIPGLTASQADSVNQLLAQLAGKAT